MRSPALGPIETSALTDRLGGPFGSAAYLGAAVCLLIPSSVTLAADSREAAAWRIAAVFATLACMPAVPDIAGELVVIAAAAVEAGAGIVDSGVEAEDVAIEAVCLFPIPHLQMHMTDAAVCRKAGPSA